ncbi:MAG TPA: hypothetical protein VIM64_11720, partial [Puia sp.]
MREKFPYRAHRMLIWSLAAVFILLSCKKNGSSPPPSPGKDSVITEISKVFGFDGQQKYAYCPSVIMQGTERHIWFCGNEPAGVFSDHIYYIRGDVT